MTRLPWVRVSPQGPLAHGWQLYAWNSPGVVLMAPALVTIGEPVSRQRPQELNLLSHKENGGRNARLASLIGAKSRIPVADDFAAVPCERFLPQGQGGPCVVPQQRRERAASTLETGSVATTERIVRKKHAIYLQM
jgi:hypothetical protein